MFSDNTTNHGGACYSINSSMSFEGNATTEFSNNTADYIGGAIFANLDTCISFKGTSKMMFNNNTAYSGGTGGAIYVAHNSMIFFKGNSIYNRV